ncbi:Leukocyte receptor cluster member 1, partial [Halocaridina rubra]
WHVRTKDNIARVRRDEAEAAEKEKEKIRRAKLAEQEARTAYLRSKVHRQDTQVSNNEKQLKKTNENQDSKNQPEADIYTKDGNINFFKEVEQGIQTSGTNKEYEAEKKAEQEKYEQSIGYLTYLGQNSNEASGTNAWYEHRSGIVNSSKNDSVLNNEEVGLKSKMKIDPINDIIKYTGLKPVKKTNPVPSSKLEISNAKLSKVLKEPSTYDKEKGEEEKTKPDKKHKKYKKEHKRKRKREKSSRNEKERDHKRIKKCKNKKNKIDKHRKRRTSDDEDTHCLKSRRYSDGSSDGSSFSSSNDSTDEEYYIEKQKKLEVLRAERLKREAEERHRAERLLAGEKPSEVEEDKNSKGTIKQKYNSQFNPHLARQNQEPKVLEAGVKYWLQ